MLADSASVSNKLNLDFEITNYLVLFPDCVGMSLMALTRYKMSVLVFSWTAGVMYSTLFTMPYLLVANYHNKGVVSTMKVDEDYFGNISSSCSLH